jgi:hypothetical protein
VADDEQGILMGHMVFCADTTIEAYEALDTQFQNHSNFAIPDNFVFSIA